MNCPTCGTTCPDESRFCYSCGSPLEPAPGALAQQPNAPLSTTVAYEVPEAMSESSRRFARYSQDLADMSRDVRNAKEAAYLADLEHDRYQSCLRNCIIAGVILAVCLISYIVPLVMSTDTENGLMVAIVAAVLSGAIGFFMPFGFTPMKNFVRDHGFFFVFSAMFLLFAAMLAFMFAVIAGPIYLIYLCSKLSGSKRDAEALHARAENLAAAYQAM